MLKSLTLCDDLELNDVIQNDSSVRAVQKKLAQEVTKFVHGTSGLQEAEIVTSILHQRKPSFEAVSDEDVDKVLRSVEVFECLDKENCISDILSEMPYFSSAEVSFRSLCIQAAVSNAGKYQQKELTAIYFFKSQRRPRDSLISSHVVSTS